MHDLKPLILIILDGFGQGKDESGNAIKAANTPVLDDVLNKYPTTSLEASGIDVGLPKGQIGNSEVGHTNIGAGRIVYQSLVRINMAIEDGSFFQNESLLKAVQNCKENNSTLHLMGLLSDGGVHSHIEHLYALLKLAKKHELKNVYLHIFTDGRDVSPTSGLKFIEKLEEKILEIGIGKIVTVCGRYYAMDRDNRWDRVKKAYDAIVEGEGEKHTKVLDALKEKYDKGITDEFIDPLVFENAKLNENDSIIFFNFRPDRARELTKALTFKNFSEFERKRGFLKNVFVCLTKYDDGFNDVFVAFDSIELKNTFGEVISKQGLKQLRIAETEKYAHVTFFFNAGKEEPFEGEDRILIKSPDVATYDLKPQMSAFEVTENVVKAIKSKKYDVIILNFANCDMVGHTGNFDAAVKAVEAVDCCLFDVLNAVKEQKGVALITADHGNAEEMISKTGEVLTSHTTNPVIFTVVFKECRLKNKGRLCDIAPTMLNILKINKPEEMTGESLIVN